MQIAEGFHVLGYLLVAGLALLVCLVPRRRQWWALIPLLALLATALIDHLFRIEPLLGYLRSYLGMGLGFALLPEVAHWMLGIPFLLGEALVLVAAGFRTQRRLPGYWIALVLLGTGLSLSLPDLFRWLLDLVVGLYVILFVWRQPELLLQWLTSTVHIQFLSIAYFGGQALLALAACSLFIRSQWARHVGWAYLVAKMALYGAYFLLWWIVRPAGGGLQGFLGSMGLGFPGSEWTTYSPLSTVQHSMPVVAPHVLKVWLGLGALVGLGIALGQPDRPAADG